MIKDFLPISRADIGAMSIVDFVDSAKTDVAEKAIW